MGRVGIEAMSAMPSCTVRELSKYKARTSKEWRDIQQTLKLYPELRIYMNSNSLFFPLGFLDLGFCVLFSLIWGSQPPSKPNSDRLSW